MLRTALASLVFSVVLYVLSAPGVAGLPVELGRIFVVVFLTLATVFTAGRLVFGRHPTDVL